MGLKVGAAGVGIGVGKEKNDGLDVNVKVGDCDGEPGRGNKCGHHKKRALGEAIEEEIEAEQAKLAAEQKAAEEQQAREAAEAAEAEYIEDRVRERQYVEDFFRDRIDHQRLRLAKFDLQDRIKADADFKMILKQDGRRPLSLTEGYSSRIGIDRDGYFFSEKSDTRITAARFEALQAVHGAQAKEKSDKDYDGFFVGAQGRVFPPTSRPNAVPPIMPSDHRATGETLIYVNGIRTTKDVQAASMQRIADHTGQPVIGIHNATRGGFLDVIQSLGDKLDIGRNPAVDTLSSTVLRELKEGRPVHIMAHSQGALITSRALQDVRNKLMLENFLKNPFTARRRTDEMMSNIKVETFGGAATHYPDGPQYVHYVNRLDPVASAFGLGSFGSPATNPGRGAVVHRFTQTGDLHGFDETYLSRRVPFEQARRNDFSR